MPYLTASNVFFLLISAKQLLFTHSFASHGIDLNHQMPQSNQSITKQHKKEQKIHRKGQKQYTVMRLT